MNRKSIRCIFFVLVFLTISGCEIQKENLNHDLPEVINKEESSSKNPGESVYQDRDDGRLNNESNGGNPQEDSQSDDSIIIHDEHDETGDYHFSLENIPDYSGSLSLVLNNNHSIFSSEELRIEPSEKYSNLDGLGRCGPAEALISRDQMPTEERGPIGDIEPSGWHTVKYNDLIDGNYLYNRCHLIGYQLSGENANEKNLITGTRCMNIEGMLPYENMVAGYIEETGNHVLYRVTPIFEGENLIAKGVVMEAKSIEDHGAGIEFNVFVYNVQPGIIIDYRTGESNVDEGYVGQVNEKEQIVQENDQNKKDPEEGSQKDTYDEETYILNTNTNKFHYPDCDSVYDMKEKNKRVTKESREEIIKQGFTPCQRCNP